MAKLWQIPSNGTSKKQHKLHPLVEEFCSGEDVQLDQELVLYDIKGSLAHAKMLEKVGVLSKEELKKVIGGLKQILKQYQQGELVISRASEDVHTAVEVKLVELVGEAGKKLHTARSRNDQVLTDIKLYIKDKLAEVENETQELIGVLNGFGKKHGDLMPGYTHMQKAMPSSLNLWAESFSAALKDDLGLVKAVVKLVDQNPLGSGAGFGVNLPVDKKLTANLLGFSKVQWNPLSCQHARGKVELAVLQSLSQIMVTLSKLAQDVLLYSTDEYGFFKVDETLTTGSSLMPQKKNLDVMELVRAKAHTLLGWSQLVGGVVAGLPSGYNRDVQETKGPLMRGLKATLESLKVCQLTVKGLEPQKQKLKEAMTGELYATEQVDELVKQGMPFRQAYRQVKEAYEKK